MKDASARAHINKLTALRDQLREQLAENQSHAAQENQRFRTQLNHARSGKNAMQWQVKQALNKLEKSRSENAVLHKALRAAKGKETTLQKTLKQTQRMAHLTRGELEQIRLALTEAREAFTKQIIETKALTSHFAPKPTHTLPTPADVLPKSLRELSELRTLIDQLRSQLTVNESAAGTARQKLVSQLNALRNERDRLLWQQKDQQSPTLRDENSTLSRTLLKVKQKLTALKIRLKETTQALERDLRLARDETQTANAMVQQIQQRLKRLRREMAAGQYAKSEKVSALTQALQAEKAALKQSQEKNKTTESSLETAKQTIESMFQRISTLIASRDEARRQAGKLMHSDSK